MKKLLGVLFAIALCASVGVVFSVDGKTYAGEYGAVVSTELFIPS